MPKIDCRQALMLALTLLLTVAAVGTTGGKPAFEAASKPASEAPTEKPQASHGKADVTQNRSSAACIQECWPGLQACQLICVFLPQTGCDWRCEIEYNGCVQACMDVPDRP